MPKIHFGVCLLFWWPLQAWRGYLGATGAELYLHFWKHILTERAERRLGVRRRSGPLYGCHLILVDLGILTLPHPPLPICTGACGRWCLRDDVTAYSKKLWGCEFFFAKWDFLQEICRTVGASGKHMWVPGGRRRTPCFGLWGVCLWDPSVMNYFPSEWAWGSKPGVTTDVNRLVKKHPAEG